MQIPQYLPTHCQITSKDLLAMQDLLCASLRAFFAFEGHALYFPTATPSQEPQLLPRERKLLLPLIWQEKRLGVLMLHKVYCREVRRIFTLLPAIAALCLENLARIRAQATDSVTGCATQETLRTHIVAEASLVRAHLDNPALHGNTPPPMHRLFMGLAVIPCLDGAALDTQVGHSFTDSLMQALATACQQDLPSDVLVARIGRHSLALLCTSSTTNCRKLTTAALQRMRDVQMKHPQTGRPVTPHLAGGYALYPRDMPAGSLLLPLEDQAHIFLAQAKLASRVAAPDAVLSCAHMLRDGGRVLEVLPRNHVAINLGNRMGLSLGQRFAVFAPAQGEDRNYKGEITIVQVEETTATAEITYLEDAAVLPEAGDGLVLQELLQSASNSEAHEVPSENDLLMSQHDFLVRYALERDRMPKYTLVALRCEDTAKLGRCAELWKETVGQHSPRAFAGQRSAGTMLACHPGEEAEELRNAYEALCTKLQADNVACAAGLAPYPFLAFNRDEIQDCAFKALEYAQLLPTPHVGICDSLALNINADRLYSLGDIFGAIDEYKRALLADKDNAMAWNSLGVCMAALGKTSDARRHFLEGLKHRPDPVRAGQICYNLGTVCQNLGERRNAARYYHQCLKHDAQHIFAWIRLGQLREQAGRRGEARHFYEKAAAIEDAQGQGNLARRHLAAVAARQRKSGEARELLQEALHRNPSDAAAMLLLARIYLDGNEDPAMAEFLARKSVGINDRPEAWQILARALRSLGREDEACMADARAMLA